MEMKTAIVHSLMKKRQVPKKQLCPKHRVLLAETFDTAPAGKRRYQVNGRMSSKKSCPICVKEKEEEAKK